MAQTFHEIETRPGDLPQLGPSARRRPAASWTRTTARRFAANRGAAAGVMVLAALVLAAVLAPLLTPYRYDRIAPLLVFSPPSAAHWLGTDHFGRDVMTRILYGGRLSLMVGLIATAVGAGLGVPIGLVAGAAGGRVDDLLMRLLDVMLAFPGLLLAIGIVAVLGTGLTNLMIAVGISTMPGFARVVRGSVLTVKENEYVQAARAVGCRAGIVMWRHILPNVTAPLIVLASLNVANAIIAGSTLNFLGMGAKPPSPEWGIMLADGRSTLARAWWISVFPGVAIMLTTMSINFIGDGLRQALDPRMKVQ
jgi:peptide/nickel transport system permease protein